jgi:hypothetical protein
MVKTSVLNDCLNAINNAEKAGKRVSCLDLTRDLDSY